jgi:multiple antibiotic resistance protein
METWQFFIFAFTSIFTIVNPVSAAFTFLTITEGDTKEKRRSMAKKAAIVCAAILIVFAFAGPFILKFFNITVDAFRIAGGILITKVGLEMVRNKPRYFGKDEHVAEKEAIEKDDISIVPMAIPLLSGPGAMTTAIVLMQQAQGAGQVSLLMFSILFTGLASFFILYYSHFIDGYLGHNGKNVVERIMGLIVLVIGVQFFINGFEGVLTTWGIIPSL